MSYADRLKQLGEDNWNNAKPAGGSMVDPGSYQVEITRAILRGSNRKDYKDHPEVAFFGKVLTGPFKGKAVPIHAIVLTRPKKGDIPSGASFFRGLLDKMEIAFPRNTEESIKRALKAAVGLVMDATVVLKNGYLNTYYNRLVNAPATKADTDEEIEEETEEVEAEEEEVEEKPKRGRPKGSKNKPKEEPAKKKAKKEEPEEEEEETETKSDDDDDEDFDNTWADE